MYLDVSRDVCQTKVRLCKQDSSLLSSVTPFLFVDLVFSKQKKEREGNRPGFLKLGTAKS